LIVENIKLLNFRNYEFFEQHFSNGINLVIGENSAGKTNLIEAVYTLANTKSFRANRDNHLIKHKTEGFYIKGEYSINSLKCTAEISYKDRIKILRFNGERAKRLRDYISKILVVLYHPLDLYIINEGPIYRRKFINIILSKTDINYFVCLRDYFKLLDQKRAALKQYKDGKIKFDIIDLLNQRLIDFAAYIVAKRAEFSNSYFSILQTKFNAIMARDYKLKITYKTGCAEIVNNKTCGFDSLKSEISANFSKALGQEIKYCRILKGIQTDEFNFECNGYPIKYFFSQGEKKGFALGLKLSEIEYIRDLTGMYPIALLDDIFSELDERRQKYLIQELSRGFQTIITDTTFHPSLNLLTNFRKIALATPQ